MLEGQDDRPTTFRGSDQAFESGPILELAVETRRLNISLFGDGALVPTIDALIAAAKSLGGSLWAASDVGERLIGGMLIRSADLELWDPNGSRLPKVVLVDGIVDGPSRLEHGAGILRQMGATEVAAALVDYRSIVRPEGVDEMASARGFRVEALGA